MIFYCFGFFSITCWAALKTPQMYMVLWFREVFKFMLSRWQPDVYYWGAVTILRNFLVACAGIVSGEPRVQFLYVSVMVILYTAFTALYSPWRLISLTYFDVASCLVLSFIGIFGLVFLSITEEIDMYKRIPGFENLVESKESQLNSFVIVLMILIAMFGCMFASLVFWCLSLLSPRVAQREMMKNQAICERITTDLKKAMAPDAQYLDKVCELVRNGTVYERNAVTSVLRKIAAAGDTIDAGLGETASFNKAKGSTGGQPANTPQATVSA